MKKFKSRTFWITIFWMGLIPFSILLQIFINIELPIEKIVELSGLISITYISGNKLAKLKK